MLTNTLGFQNLKIVQCVGVHKTTLKIDPDPETLFFCVFSFHHFLKIPFSVEHQINASYKANASFKAST